MAVIFLGRSDFYMKRLLTIMLIVIDICAVAAIPLNLFVFNMPQFISVIFAVLIVVLNGIFIIKGKSRKLITKCVVSFISVVVVLFILFGTYCNPYWNSVSFKNNDFQTYEYDHMLTNDEAEKDLDYAMESLKKIHPKFKDGVPQDIQERYEKVKNKVETDSRIDIRTLNELIESIFSKVNDGHTVVTAVYDDYHYLKDADKHKQDGDKLVEVNGMKIDDLFSRNKMLYSYFDESWGKRSMRNDLVTLEGLRYLRIPVDSDISYTYEDKNDRRDTKVYHSSDFAVKDKSKNKDKPFVYYDIDKEHSLAVLTLDKCTYNDQYKNCVKEMFTKVKEMGIKNVAVDLRNNDGGSSLVADEFIRYLNVDNYSQGTSEMRLGCFTVPFDNSSVKNKKYNDLLFRGNVYALTSVGTFSSGMDIAQYIKDNHLGKTVGQAPGNNPNGYGEVAEFMLPNSKMYMQISTTKFNRADKLTKDKLIMPDVECDSSDALKVLYEKLK